MIPHNRTPPDEPLREGKYARVERERRFLLESPPPLTAATARRRITDRYLPGTRMRLRRVEHLDSGACELKLTQKVPAGRPGHVRGLITSIYLSAAEYDLLASLPAQLLSKTRFSVPPLGIDIFDPPLHGLVLAEAEFSTDEAAQSFRPHPATIAEVTDDPRFAAAYYHSGDNPGYRSLACWIPDRAASIVILVNDEAASTTGLLRQLLPAALGA
jgi:CYTH domain-containing protein